MVGQGRPKTSHGCAASRSAVPGRCVYRFALAAVLTLVTAEGFAEQQTIRLRIAWGGGAEQTWSGRVSVDQGTLSDPRPLGIEADEPGSMWIEDDQLVLRQRSTRTYDAVDLLVDAPDESTLTIAFSPLGQSAERPPLTVPLKRLLADSFSAELDDQGNRLLVSRAPGDTLRLTLPEGPLVFSPGETLRLELTTHRLPVPSGTAVQIAGELVRGRSSEALWTTEHQVSGGVPKKIPLEIELGSDEGVYELVIRATRDSGPGWATRLRGPLGWRQTVAERRVQLVVIDPQEPDQTTAAEPVLSPVVEIDPANPKWYERFAKLPQLPGLPRLWKEPLGNGALQPWRHPDLGQAVRLAPNRSASDVSWEAYSLPIDRPGRPHVLEVQYPSDLVQTLGISVVEPNAAGAVMPIGLDSGVCRADEIGTSAKPARWLVHRMIFWPRTKAPMVLITNRRADRPAVFGRIRVLDGWKHLPRAYPVAEEEGGGRSLAAYLDRPLFCENFSASESPFTLSDRSLDDWVTFYEGGSRLVEYLRHVGYNGLMLSVMADASTIYPSRRLQPTPRYDTGPLFETGLDPVRKDVLEMLFRMFDRAGMELIPAMEFAAPLPELEAVLRRNEPEAAGLVWIGPEGTAWTQTHLPRRGLAPYYNVLHPRVQEAMIEAIREVTRRYGQHPSFSGMALQLSAYGYAQLPGPEWGMDDETIARFQRDTGLKVPGQGPKRFRARADFLTGPHRRAWLQWRAAQLSQFYARVEAELKAACPQGRLYLAGADMFSGPEMERRLRPSLGRRTSIAEVLLDLGIDTDRFHEAEGPVLLRSEQISPLGPATARAVNLEIARMFDSDGTFAQLPLPGSLFSQQPRQLAVASFDRKSPFRRSHTVLFTHPASSGWQNRRRLVHALAAIDSQCVFDGGWMLPLGQEDALRDLVAAYRRLPKVRFQTVAESPHRQSVQPVTIRYASYQGQTYVYAVNDAPIDVTARVRLDVPIGCRLEELSGMRSVRPLDYDRQGARWSVDLKPYDFVAVRLGSPHAKVFDPQADVPARLRDALDLRIRDLGTRAAALRSPPPLGLLANAGFENRPGADAPIPDWSASQKKDVTVEIDTTRRHVGLQSIRLSSRGPIACLVSDPVPAPKTGRFSMLVWLRVADTDQQPPLRLAVEWERRGREYRFAQVGKAAGAEKTVSVSTEWAPYIFQVYDLPLDGVSQLRVRFDLMGPGEVWVDDVQLSDLAFSRTEMVELSKLITVAASKLQRGQLGDCIRLLESYWPQFLESNVPLESQAIARKPQPARSEERPDRQPERTSKILGRMKGLLPRSLRF